MAKLVRAGGRAVVAGATGTHDNDAPCALCTASAHTTSITATDRIMPWEKRQDPVKHSSQIGLRQPQAVPECFIASSKICNTARSA